MAAKNRVLAIFGAILAGNWGYNACGDRYGRKTTVRNRKLRTVDRTKSGLELSQVHVALLGQSLVEGKGFVKGVACLALLGYLEVIPHELLVVGVHAVFDDALGTLGG